jgi:uncharacterized SAM-binding protein YcdF (DUF218 family)
MNRKFHVFGIVFITIIVYVGGCRNAGLWLVKEDKPLPEHSDAIVILMGSIPDRVLQAADLYQSGQNSKIIIVESSMGEYKRLKERGVHIISDTEQLCNALITMNIPKDNINIIPGDASSTLMEVSIIRAYLIDKPEIDTILLVSSAPHTRRAFKIFRAAFRMADMPVCIVCVPSTYTNFNAAKWWRSKEGIQSVFMEYLKIASFMLFERRILSMN